jgi:hypothetical protein
VVSQGDGPLTYEVQVGGDLFTRHIDHMKPNFTRTTREKTEDEERDETDQRMDAALDTMSPGSAPVQPRRHEPPQPASPVKPVIIPVTLPVPAAAPLQPLPVAQPPAVPEPTQPSSSLKPAQARPEEIPQPRRSTRTSKPPVKFADVYWGRGSTKPD